MDMFGGALRQTDQQHTPFIHHLESHNFSNCLRPLWAGGIPICPDSIKQFQDSCVDSYLTLEILSFSCCVVMAETCVVGPSSTHGGQIQRYVVSKSDILRCCQK